MSINVITNSVSIFDFRYWDQSSKARELISTRRSDLLHVINEGKLLKKNLMIFADHPCKLRLEPNLKWAVMGLELLISEDAWKVETGYAKSMTNLYRNTKTIYHLAVRSTVYSDVLANIKICLSGANKEVASFKIS